MYSILFTLECNVQPKCIGTGTCELFLIARFWYVTLYIRKHVESGSYFSGIGMGLEFTWLNSGLFSQVRQPGNKRDEDWYAGCATWEIPFSCVFWGILRRMDQTESIISRVVQVCFCTNLAQTASNNTGTCWHRLQRVSPFRAARPQGCLPELLAV